MLATAPMLPDAIALMKAWGFTFKSAGTWAKRSSTGKKWAFGTGYCFRSAAEFYLLGTIGKSKVSQSMSARVRQRAFESFEYGTSVAAITPPGSTYRLSSIGACSARWPPRLFRLGSRDI
jgi:N6-adenosine-specific RNA methylase IME4